MKFDWYQGTIEETNPVVVLEVLSQLGHEIVRNDNVGKMYRFERGWEVHHHDRGVVARVAAGGNGDHVHAWATSDDAPAFADLVRAQWPESHLVTRMDSSEDFYETGAYSRLRRVARRIAKTHRLGFRQLKDELNTRAGRTQYIGSSRSEQYGRLYEKGFEVAAKSVEKIYSTKGRLVSCSEPSGLVLNESTGELIRAEDWTRLELQLRPKERIARRIAAVATPEQCWSFSPWCQDLARDALALDLERMYIRTKRMSKDEETLRWMCRQYAAVLLRLRDKLGTFSDVGNHLGEIIEESRQWNR